MLWTLMGAGLVETIYGFGQLYGWFASGHSLYRLTGSFLTRGLIRDFSDGIAGRFVLLFIGVSRSAKRVSVSGGTSWSPALSGGYCC